MNLTNYSLADPDQSSITYWIQFAEQVRKKGHPLLKRLDDFPGAILVTGCQRSGTTMLSRIITQSEGMTDYWFGLDDELDAALILAGQVDHQPQGRYCFQTTYLDNFYKEYFAHTGDFQIIWVIRNPLSVVYSLLYNWNPLALDNTFESIGPQLLKDPHKLLFRLIGTHAVSRVQRACLIYNAKALQLFELRKAFGPEKMIVVDYDELVNNKEIALCKVFEFAGISYRDQYSQKIHSKSLDKKHLLNKFEISQIVRLSQPLYKTAWRLRDVRFE
jgi:hypothetical protein